MEKKIIVFCVAAGIVLIGVVCGIRIFDTLSSSNAAMASVTTSKNDQISSPNTVTTPQRVRTKEFETYHNVEPIPDLVTLMLATPDKK